MLKGAAYFVTGSVALLTAVADSALDLFGSLGILFAVRWANSPADRQHRYGHGKAEPLAGLARAAFVFGSATLLLIEAIQRLIAPQPLASTSWGLSAITTSIVLTAGLVVYQGRVLREMPSPALAADHLEYRADLLTNTGILIGLGVSSATGWLWLDPLLALAIVAWICWNALGIARDSIDQLMDREVPSEERRELEDRCFSHPGVLAIHDLRTRVSGRDRFVEVHIELAPELSVIEAHLLIDAVERQVRGHRPGTQVLAHLDPLGHTQDASGQGIDRLTREEWLARREKPSIEGEALEAPTP
jgi:ferrous-iron efflux pump FieF